MKQATLHSTCCHVKCRHHTSDRAGKAYSQRGVQIVGFENLWIPHCREYPCCQVTSAAGLADCHKNKWESLGMKRLELPRPVSTPIRMRGHVPDDLSHPILTLLGPFAPNRIGARRIASYFPSGCIPTPTGPECNRGPSHVSPSFSHVVLEWQVKRTTGIHVRFVPVGVHYVLTSTKYQRKPSCSYLKLYTPEFHNCSNQFSNRFPSIVHRAEELAATRWRNTTSS